MRLKDLEGALQGVEPFARPKVALEQYPTQPHIAARMLYAIETTYGDIDGCLVGDFGCGCGMLSVGAALLGAGHVVGLDIDPDALATACENRAELELDDDIDFVLSDVTGGREGAPLPPAALRGLPLFDTVLMNPPFGTKSNRGVDMAFARAGIACASRAVYSLHKSSTREHIMKKAGDWGVGFEVVAELRFDLPRTYRFHKKASVDIEVDLIRFDCSRRAPTS